MDPFELTPEQISLLENELEEYAKNPDEGSSWQEIKERVLSAK